MDIMQSLVEQHVKEAESRLRHIDELMQQAADAQMHEERLASFGREHKALHQSVARLRESAPAQASEGVRVGTGLVARLEALGLELEKALTAIGDQRRLSTRGPGA